MEENKHIRILSRESVPKALIKLGIPTMVGMMVSSLYNLVDAYFVGKLGTSQQAAVSALYPISLIMLGIGLLFGSGAGSYLSRLLGDKQQKKADECASTALFTGVIAAVVAVAAMLVFLNPLLHALGCTATMMPYAREYAVPFIGGLVINVFNCTMSNIATSEGASMYSMRSMLMGGVANIILDPILIYALHMGVAGAAYATLISRIISFVTYLFFILGRKSCFDYSIKNFRPSAALYGEIAKIGVPTLIYQALCGVVLSVVNNFAADYGDSAVAACGIVSRITSFCAMTAMGFLKGYQPFVGYNYGAKRYDRVKKATNTILLWCTVYCAVVCAGLIIFRVPIIRAFNAKDATVLKIGAKMLTANAVTFLTMGMQLTYSIKFMGLGKAMEGGLISLGRQGIFFIPIIIVFTHIFGLNGIIFSQPAADMLSLVLVIFLAFKNRKEENMLMEASV